MRSVRKTFAWLPLWVLVLLVGGCSDEFGCKSMQGDAYTDIRKDREGRAGGKYSSFI